MTASINELMLAGRLAGKPVRSLSGSGSVEFADGQTGTAEDLAPELASIRRAEAQRAARAVIDRMAEVLTAKYTAAEQQAWPTKIVEARAYQVSAQTADAPTIAAEAAVRGIPVATLAAIIIAAASMTTPLAAICAGMRANVNAEIDASDGTPAALAAIAADLQSKATAVANAVSANDPAAALAAAQA